MDRKIDYFAEVISREVEAKKRRAKHQLANDFSKNTAAAIEAAEKKVQTRIEAARNELAREANKKISIATARAKAEYFTKRNALQAELLDTVAEELISFTKSDEYEKYLIDKINLAKENFTAVKLCPQGMRHAEAIAQATGLTAEAGDDDYLGGFILKSKNGRVKADFTFRTRLENAI